LIFYITSKCRIIPLIYTFLKMKAGSEKLVFSGGGTGGEGENMRKG
jgi:hypothetical protein